MDLFETIYTRRTIRTFTAKKIPKSDLEKLVDAGRLAPSATNRQMWDFVVITEKKILDDILPHFHAGRKYGTHEDGKFDGISAIIAVIMDGSNEYWKEDGAAATQNMLLAAHALGLGACWIGSYGSIYEEKAKDILGVPKGERLLSVITVGYPAGVPTGSSRKALKEITFSNKYGKR